MQYRCLVLVKCIQVSEFSVDAETEQEAHAEAEKHWPRHVRVMPEETEYVIEPVQSA